MMILGSGDAGSDNPNAAAFIGAFDGTTVEGNYFLTIHLMPQIGLVLPMKIKRCIH